MRRHSRTFRAVPNVICTNKFSYSQAIILAGVVRCYIFFLLSCVASIRRARMAAASKVVPSDSATVSLRGMVTWTLRGHWKLWYPWVLVVTQAIFIVVLLVTLERESVRPNKHLQIDDVTNDATCFAN